MNVYNLVKTIGAYVAVLGGVDALVFTAGIGENSNIIRQKVCDRLSYLGISLDETKNNLHPAPLERSSDNSKIKVLVIHANEELMIARETYELIVENRGKEAIAV